MGPSIRETEIKLRFDSCRDAVARLESLGASLVEQRSFEDNLVYDDARRSLGGSGRLLRLRSRGTTHVLTYKEQEPTTDSRYKVRREIEVPLDGPEPMRAILERLGFRPVYRYQKYRTRYHIDRVEASIDETPLGCFVELEGEPQAIERLAARMGLSPESYIVSTYRELHEQAVAPGAHPGDLLMDDPDAPRGP
jgi:adenylate cyclase class 2